MKNLMRPINALQLRFQSSLKTKSLDVASLDSMTFPISWLNFTMDVSLTFNSKDALKLAL